MVFRIGFIKYSPTFLLLFLIIISVIIFGERGTFGAVIHLLKEGSEALDNVQVGVLASVFMFGFMFGSPIAAHFSQYTHPFNLMTIGLGIWSLSCLAFSAFRKFYALVLIRTLTGAGEAFFISLAPTIIVDSAPESRKTCYLGLFMAMIGIGVAMGFVYGELVSSATGAWYYPFAYLGLAMAVLTIIMLFSYRDPAFLIKKVGSHY